MVKGQHYKIIVVAGTQGLDPLRDNVDVEVVFDDGSRFVATFFTLENVQMIMDGYRQTGECSKGLYFWASDMILVRRLTRQNIAKVVGDLIGEGEFEKAFSQVPPSVLE
ncbi:MAG: hypothetical protein ACLQNE_10230 [Thermoguttaceae bacterium]|jgi:hypothetical protein